MPKKQKNSKTGSAYPIGKKAGKQQQDKSDFYHKHKSTIWTIIVLFILTIFFIVNNTRKIPDQGSYPPNYKSANTSEETTQP
jgi:hypothetical protein